MDAFQSNLSSAEIDSSGSKRAKYLSGPPLNVAALGLVHEPSGVTASLINLRGSGSILITEAEAARTQSNFVAWAIRTAFSLASSQLPDPATRL